MTMLSLETGLAGSPLTPSPYTLFNITAPCPSQTREGEKWTGMVKEEEWRESTFHSLSGHLKAELFRRAYGTDLAPV